MVQKLCGDIFRYRYSNKGNDPDIISMHPEYFYMLVGEVRNQFNTMMDIEYKTFMGIRILTSANLEKDEIILSNDNSK